MLDLNEPVEVVEETKPLIDLGYVGVHWWSYNNVQCPFCNVQDKLYRWSSFKKCPKCPNTTWQGLGALAVRRIEK